MMLCWLIKRRRDPDRIGIVDAVLQWYVGRTDIRSRLTTLPFKLTGSLLLCWRLSKMLKSRNRFVEPEVNTESIKNQPPYPRNDGLEGLSVFG